VIAGQVSHLVHKVAAAGEFRLQASHGGSEQLVDPDDATAELERTVLALVGHLAYARVDYIVDLVLGGRDDPLSTPSSMTDLAGALTGSKRCDLTLVVDAGHTLFADQPSRRTPLSETG